MAAELSVDLRSDTVTQPTAAMRAAMAQAPVGDDVYGEDPTVALLESRVAALLGHEAALFCPTGSMANMLGVRLLVGAGQELLCDSLAHVVRAELGGHAVLGQVTTRTWAAPRGLLDADLPLAMATPDAGPYLVSTAAIAVENTHNFGGGTVQPLAELRRLHAGAAAVGVAVHLDGARLWNAHVATGVPLADYGACADTVSVCLSKGLGAPVGSLLVASAERIATARVWRKRYGGGMRQVGILAAAGLHALDHHVARLAEDHARARRIAAAVAASRPDLLDGPFDGPVDGSLDGSFDGPADRLVDGFGVQTNIVVLSAPDLAAAEVAGAAREHGVLVSTLGPRGLRLVTHLGIDDDQADHAARVLTALLARRTPSTIPLGAAG